MKPSLTLDPDLGSTNLVTVLSCVYSLLDALPVLSYTVTIALEALTWSGVQVLSYTLPGLSVAAIALSVSLYNMLWSVPCLSCWDVTNYAVNDLETSRPDGKRPSQVGDVYDRLVSFQVRLVCVCCGSVPEHLFRSVLPM